MGMGLFVEMKLNLMDEKIKENMTRGKLQTFHQLQGSK
jgi:hypothetical protein